MKRRRISKKTFSALLVLIVWTTIALTHVIVLLGAARAETYRPSVRPRTGVTELTPAPAARNLELWTERLDLNRKAAGPNAIPAPETDVSEPSTSPAI